MECNLKDIDNSFRQHGIEAEDAFFAVSSFYIQYYKLNSKTRISAIKDKGQIFLQRCQDDKSLINQLQNIVKNDPKGELLPVIYQFFLAKRFRDSSGKFFTPTTVAEAMASILPIKENAKIMDPTCGGGTFLLEVAKRWGTKDCVLIGNDIDEMLINLTELVLSLGCGKNCKTILCNSNIYNPSSDIQKLFGKIDYVLANPPFSLVIETFDNQSKLFKNGYKNSDALFLDLALKLLKSGGRLVCLLPHSIVSNNEYKQLRLIVEEDWDMEGVIILPEGVFQLTSNTTTRADIIILSKKGSDNANQKIVFANAPSIGISLKNRVINENVNHLHEILSTEEVIDAFHNSTVV
ncbi:MAG TPA: restriction endonuclease subunit M [Candidatus Atribacteria bacterium]|nr:restriction endonuclease subunit M [Candidatus Atribacteria bacterium]